MSCGFTFTVFTPTFNRARLLPTLFQSLCAQTCRDFEWLIVDDGSVDDTADVVSAFQAISNFPIIYIVQAHGGKHKAVNTGVQRARGRFFGIADSDDAYTPDALELCARHFAEIPETEKPHFVGMTGLCATPNGQVIGSKFPANVFDSDALELVACRVRGDKAGFLLADVMKQFPFPEGIGPFVTEGLIWNRIARRYRTRYFNRIVQIRDYQPDGLTAKSAELRMHSPIAARQYYEELISTGRRMPVDVLLRHYANYVRFSRHEGRTLREQFACAPHKSYFVASAALGCALYQRDRLMFSGSTSMAYKDSAWRFPQC